MKRYLVVSAIILAFIASAFTTSKNKSNLVGNSYNYDLYGSPNQDLPANLNNPANYTFVGTSPLTCSGSAHRCGVQDAQDDGTGHPDFSKPYTIRTRD